MPFIRLWLALLLLLGAPSLVRAGILNLRSGLGTVVQKDWDTHESVRYGLVVLSGSYRTPVMDLSLELPFRWDIRSKEFDDGIWDRDGDFIRPLKLLRYRSERGDWTGGFEVLTDWTPGTGLLVRGLSGWGEVDYVLPGLRFTWSSDTFDIDAGMDRPVDPTVQAVALKWKSTRGLSIVLEGAVDPDAPVVFSGASSGGRPAADVSERLAAKAAGINLDLYGGNLLTLAVGAHTGDINGDARGIGGEVSASFDFSHFYHNRLKFRARTTTCKDGYVPAWFESAYPLHRWGPQGQAFLQLNPLDSTVPDKTMSSYDIEYALGDFLSIRTWLDMFNDDSLRRAGFEARIMEENDRGLELFFWTQTDDPDARLFTVDSNLHSRLRALYNVLPHFLLTVSFDHSWSFREEEAGFKPLNTVTAGVVYDIAL